MILSYTTADDNRHENLVMWQDNYPTAKTTKQLCRPNSSLSTAGDQTAEDLEVNIRENYYVYANDILQTSVKHFFRVLSDGDESVDITLISV